MPAIKNIDKAYKKINKEAVNHDGLLTKAIFMDIFNSAVKEFNLDETKVKELKALRYEREIDEDEEASEEPEEQTLEEIVAAQAAQIENLTAALSKIATLTGYGNHLKEFNIEKWCPGKKDLKKNFG